MKEGKMRCRPLNLGRRQIMAGSLLLAAGVLIILGAAANALSFEDKQTACREIYPLIQESDLRSHIAFMEGLGSRVAGYPGNEKAALYVAEQFQRLGLEDVSKQAEPERFGPKRPYMEAFEVTTPIVRSASLQVMEGSRGRVRIYPLWPNVVRTSQFPAGGVDIPLIYAGRGSLTEFSGKEVEGAAVLMEFDTGGDWLNASRLGAKAVIFIAPERTGAGAERGEAESKFLKVPVDIPRFWIRREDAWPLLARLKSQAEVKVHLECDMAWEKRRSWNIIGEIPGSDPALSAETIYIEAYYDSMSVVPELAPGAESAGGIAALIELARAFKEHPPKRTVRFLATGAHFFSLTGIRSYFSQHMRDLTVGEPASRPGKFLGFIPYTDDYREKLQINYFCALDLSSQSSGVGIFCKGMYYDVLDDNYIWNFTAFSRMCRENADLAGGEFPEAAGAFTDTANPPEGKKWSNYIMGKVALDNEPITLAGGMGVCFLTTDDSRALVDTPLDRLEEMNLPNLLRQARLLSFLLWGVVNDPDMAIQKDPAFSRFTTHGGFSLLTGRAVQFEGREGIVPNKVIPGTLVVMHTRHSTLMGVRGDAVDMVDAQGRFTFDGVANLNARHERRMTRLEAYHLDPDTGSVDFAVDQGPEMSLNYPASILLTKARTDRILVIFPCVSFVLYDSVDPQMLASLVRGTIFDGESNISPASFGASVAQTEAWLSHVEDLAIVFVKPGTRLKIVLSTLPGQIRYVLLNAATMSDEHPTGLGYLVDRSMTLANIPLAVARDMVALDERRIQKLARFRIVNENVIELHRLAQDYIARAEKALARRDYVATNSLARAAWGYESKAYPEIQATNDDVVKGVIFYLFLMLPFCFFMERLILAAPNLKRQITGMVGIFAATCIIFSRIHPAFRISTSPWIVPLAFVMLALSTVVIFLVMTKFEAHLRAIQQQMGGMHRADIGRLGVATAAFGLGISNMRKRRARTFFTCITLIVLTFTVLSFTSVVSQMRFNVRRSKGMPRYQGILIRKGDWEALEEPAYRVLNDEFGATRAVAPRAWFFTYLPEELMNSGTQVQQESQVTITSNKSDKAYKSKALAGLAPEEREVTGLDRALEWGRWFTPGDKNVCIIPTAMAQTFSIGPKDAGRAKIYIGGVPFSLIGVLDTSRASSILDLDQERLTPVDLFTMMRGTASMAGGSLEYIHLSPDDVVFIPYKTALSMGAQLRSVAVGFTTAEEVQDTLEKLMPRLALNLYAGEGKQIYRWSSKATTSVGGLQDLAVPIIIAALIVLNTMLGSVYERVKEIHIFSSLGLAPNHIATLFMAEAFVYAVLGAMFGYLVGQSVAIIITGYGLTSGLYLNYSSISAVASTAIVIATVMLSTIYPARKASAVATPAVERHWHLPEPEGDKLEIVLPFAVTGGQASALNAFMSEWFHGYAEYSVGEFVTENVQTSRVEGAHGLGYCISLMTWLAPFDLGVSQRTELHTIATDMEDVYEIKLILYRESGEVSSWTRVNHRFLNTLRKQFLIWRTLSAGDRDRYLGISQSITGEPAPEAAG
jgi:hypothetical protein